MASFNTSMDNNVTRCLKHHPTWQPRVQQLLNMMRDTLIPKIYINRINNLLCSCGKRRVGVQPNMGYSWDDVTDAQFQQSIKFIDNHIMQNIDNPHVPIIKKVMEWMRKDEEINPENSTAPPPAPRSSALKLLFILQKVIEKDFRIMEPHKTVPVQQSKKTERKELCLKIQLEDYAPELLGQLVGANGHNIMIFMKQEKCYVCFEIVGNELNEKMMATIKKTAEDMSVLEHVGEELKKFANETQEKVMSTDDGYPELTPQVLSVIDEVDQMHQGELQEEFKELIEDADCFKPGVKFNDITTHYHKHPNTRYRAVTRKMPLISQIRTFNNAKMKFASATPLVQTARQISSLSLRRSVSNESTIGTSMTLGADRISATAIPKSTASSGSSVRKVTQSGASSVGGVTNQMAGTSTVVHDIDLRKAAADDPCPTNCLVHDRRWVSTYQYTLTQCYTHIRLPRKQGSKFSRLICTCDKPRPEARLYFVVEDYMVKAFNQCKEKIGRWPQACRNIMKPLITHLEKYDKSEVWHSLFKFVFYFTSVDSASMNVLNNDHKLPGKVAAYIPRQEKQYFYQANIPITMVHPSMATVTQSTASLLGASGSSMPQPGAGASSSSETRKMVRLKRLCSDDWIDDCYYHGKKKKSVFQCLLNYLHKHAGLPVKLNIPFSMAVCACDEKIELKDFYNSEELCRDDCRMMKSKLGSWKGDSRSSIQPYIKFLEDYINHKQNLTDGFLKVVYHFNQVYRRDMKLYEELRDLVRKQRNKQQ